MMTAIKDQLLGLAPKDSASQDRSADEARARRDASSCVETLPPSYDASMTPAQAPSSRPGFHASPSPGYGRGRQTAAAPVSDFPPEKADLNRPPLGGSALNGAHPNGTSPRGATSGGHPPGGSTTDPARSRATSAPIPARAAVYYVPNDRIGFIGFEPELDDALRRLLREDWPKGIGGERVEREPRVLEFKLSPAVSYVSDHHLAETRLFASLFAFLASRGWAYDAAALQNTTLGTNDSLFFRRGAPRARRVVPIAFPSYDKVQLIDWEDEEVLRVWRTAAEDWPVVQKTGVHGDGIWEVKLKGTPWWSRDALGIAQSRVMMCGLLQAMEQAGYQPVASMTLYGRVLTWFFASI